MIWFKVVPYNTDDIQLLYGSILNQLITGADTEKLKGGGTGYCNQGSVRKHTKARGSGGMPPQENFGKYDL